MKAFVQIVLLIFLVFTLSCKQGAKKATAEVIKIEKVVEANSAKRIPEEEANQWRKQLEDSKSGDSIYLPFNNIYFCIDSVREDSHKNDHHLMFYFGKYENERSMFMVECEGKLEAGKFKLINSTISKLVGSSLEKVDTTTFYAYTQEWENYMEKEQSLFYKAFIVPNEDLDSLHKHLDKKKDIFLTFGLTDNKIKMLLSKKPVKIVTTTDKSVTDPGPVIGNLTFDACTPCPEVCP